MGFASKEYGSEEQCKCAVRLCPQDDSNFMDSDLMRQCSMLDLWLVSFEEKQFIPVYSHVVLDHGAMLPELQQTLCFHFIAVLFKADFFLEFFHQKMFLFPWMWIHEVHLWLFSPSASHCLRPKIRCAVFQKICCAKSGEFLMSLTMCLLSVPCSGAWVYICSPQSDSYNLVASIPQLLKFPNTSQDVVTPYRLSYIDYIGDCFWRNSSNTRFVRFTRFNFKTTLKTLPVSNSKG